MMRKRRWCFGFTLLTIHMKVRNSRKTLLIVGCDDKVLHHAYTFEEGVRGSIHFIFRRLLVSMLAWKRLRDIRESHLIIDLKVKT